MLAFLQREQATMPFDKVRIRFRKSGDLRMVSHLDLMRAFERMLRRANLPFRMTEGFHPTPRLIFAQSLSLGVIGLNEVVELELTEPLEPADVLTRLQAQAPPGLVFLNAHRIPIKTTARPRRATYRLRRNAEVGTQHAERENQEGDSSAAFSGSACRVPISDERLTTLLNQQEVWVEREKPRPRQLNIRPYLETLTVTDDAIVVTTWLTQEGTVRADELVRVLGLPPDTLIERTHLELLDEVTPEEAARTPKIELHTRPWNAPHTPVPDNNTPAEVWGATANGPVVE